MKRILINATQPDEIRVAQVNRGRLIDFDIERSGEESTKGNVYKGRVTAVKPDLEAAFVEYGAERHGLLSMRKLVPTDFPNASEDASSEQRKIEDLLKVDQELLVQVDKEPYGHKKGAALTTDFSLVGRFTVLKPKNPDGGISLQITGDALDEMKEILSSLEIPEGMGLILRTASKGMSKKEIQEDLDIVLRAWKAIETEGEQAEAPCLIFQENSLVRRIVRDKLRDDIDELVVDDLDVFDELSSYIKGFMPGLENQIQLHEEDQPLFSKYRIEKDISRAFDREVVLPSGGRITIDPTEALASIDVNSARAKTGASMAQTAFHTNCEAVSEIARQLRLRDIGGLIVVDFIDMENSEDRASVEARMEEALSEDRANTSVTSISRFGLMEMQRQRMRPPLHDTSFESCPRCSGSGRIRDTRSTALSALRDIEAAAGSRGLSNVQANTPLDVATYLMNEKRTDVLDIERRSRTRVVIVPDSNIHTPNYHVQQIGFGDARYSSDMPSYSRQLDQSEKRNNGRGRKYEPEKKKLDPQTPLVKSEHQVEFTKNGRNVVAGTDSKSGKAMPQANGLAPGRLRIWKRLASTLFGGPSVQAKVKQKTAGRRKKSETDRRQKDAVEQPTTYRNAPIVLPNGEKRADYIRRRFYEDDAPRGQIIREINQMNQEKHGSDYRRLNPSAVYQATRGTKPAAGSEDNRKSESREDRKVISNETQEDRTDRNTRASGKRRPETGADAGSSQKDKIERRSKDNADKSRRELQAKGEEQPTKRKRKSARRSGSPASVNNRPGRRGASDDEAFVDQKALSQVSNDHDEPSVAELFLQMDQEKESNSENEPAREVEYNEEMEAGDAEDSTDPTNQLDSNDENVPDSGTESPVEIENSEPDKFRAKNDPRSGGFPTLDDPAETPVVMDDLEFGNQTEVTTTNANDFLKPSPNVQESIPGSYETGESEFNDIDPNGSSQVSEVERAHNDPRNQTQS